MTTVYCMTPWHRPNDLSNLIANFNRQKYDNKYLILCANGDCFSLDSPPDLPENSVRFSSDAGVGNARNACLNMIRKLARTGDVVAHMDADDHYGPEYLIEAMRTYESGKLSGRTEVEINTSTLGSFRGTLMFHGATFVYDRLDLNFLPIECGEDHEFLKNYGRDDLIYVHYSDQYVYNRIDYGRGNTWTATDWEIKNLNQYSATVQFNP